MATEVGSAYVSIIPSARGFGSSLNRQVGPEVGSVGSAAGKKSGEQFKKTFLPSVKDVIAVGAGLAIGRGIASFFRGTVGEAREAAKVTALTNQVIKSTGGIAGITADQVSKLSTALSIKSGIDDEAIQSGANLLLTFTNIRNEAGKGNDVFNQATALANDLSVALGQDMKSSSIQLGKALNDPVRGVTALQRVGVAFTKDQKDQIKTLVQSGDTLAAQKVILAEISREFGGAAEAAASPADKLKVAYANLQEQVGTALLPVLNSLVSTLTTVLAFTQRNSNVIFPLVGAFAALAAIVFTVNATARAYAATQAAVAVVQRLLVGSVNAETGARSAGLIVRVRETASLVAHRVALIATAAATKAVTAGQWLLNAALTANPIGLVVVAIAALVAGFILAYKNSETFRRIVQATFRGIQVVAGNAISIIILGFRFLLNVWLTVAGGILNGAAKAFGWIPGIGGKLKGAAAAFDGFKTSTLATLSSIADSAAGWGDRTAQSYTQGLSAGLVKRGVAAPVAVGTSNKVGSLARTGAAFESTGPATNITVNNPVPEPASESVDKALRRKRHAAGWSAG